MEEKKINGIDIIAKELFNLQEEYEKSFINIVANKNEDNYATCLIELKKCYEKNFDRLVRLLAEYIHISSILGAAGYEIRNINLYRDRETGKYSIILDVERMLCEYIPKKYEELKEKSIKKFFSSIEDSSFGKQEIEIVEREIEKLKYKYLSIDQAVNLDRRGNLMIVSDFGEIYVEVVEEKVY